MTQDEIWDEYVTNKTVSGKALLALKQMLRESDDPYSVITLAGDVAAFQLADDIAVHLDHQDPMVRWNAAGVLFTRFRDVRFAARCLKMLNEDSDELVQGILLRGLGQLLPLVQDKGLQRRMAQQLLNVFEGRIKFSDGIPGPDDAYGGLEAAVGVPLVDQAPSYCELDPEKDYKPEVIAEFRRMYGV